MKIISWNIAGAHTIASLEHFDYDQEDLLYFVDEIRKIDPDIICLQESHTAISEEKSNALELANALGFEYVLNSPSSPSHINSAFKLGIAILSKEPFLETEMVTFPNPDEPLFWKDGRPAATHEKNIQVATYKNFSIANNQMLPVTLFGLSYEEGVGARLAKGINEIVENKLRNPIIWCGDFNHDRPLDIYAHMSTLGLVDALPDVATRPSLDELKKRSDHIFYSPEFNLIDSGVVHTNTDHFLCFAEFNLS